MRVAWLPYFPVEWLPDLPAELQGLARQHPATWQRVLWDEFKSLPNLRLDIVVPRGNFVRSHTFEREGTRFHCIRTPKGLRAASFYWLDTWLIAKTLRQIRPDVVHAWGTEFAGAAIAGRLHYPTLVTMQGILTWYGSVFPLNRHQKLSRFLEPASLRRAKIATCESSFGMEYLRERYPHLKLLQIEHAPSPIFSAIQRRPQIQPARILCVGSFLEWKGADVVMKALNGLVSKFPFQLLWIGSKNRALEETLRAQTSSELWSRISFKHDIPPAEIARELGTATLFVHAARADNSPNSVKEAAVAGVPVVATNTGGIPDYIFPGKNGYLFKSGDAEDCRNQIGKALTHHDFSRGEVAAETLGKVRKYLSATTMAEKFYDGYKIAWAEYLSSAPR